MDANQTANRRRAVALVAVVFAFVCTAPAARACVLVQTPAAVRPVPTRSQVEAIQHAADGTLPDTYSAVDHVAATSSQETRALSRAALLAAILLIPPPIDVIAGIPQSQPSTTHPVVANSPGLTVTPTSPDTGGGNTVNAAGAPEPTTL